VGKEGPFESLNNTEREFIIKLIEGMGKINVP
jgi:hypothetical protein